MPSEITSEHLDAFLVDSIRRQHGHHAELRHHRQVLPQAQGDGDVPRHDRRVFRGHGLPPAHRAPPASLRLHGGYAARRRRHAQLLRRRPLLSPARAGRDFIEWSRDGQTDVREGQRGAREQQLCPGAVLSLERTRPDLHWTENPQRMRGPGVSRQTGSEC